MPSHKTLKSVVRSFAESFTSLMNYSGEDYIMGHIVFTAWQSGDTEINVDVLSGSIEPSKLLIKPVHSSINHYIHSFPTLIESSGSSMAFVKEATLSIKVDPSTRRPILSDSDLMESPFSCVVRIVDERGKLYTHKIEGWWYPEHPPITETRLTKLSRGFLKLLRHDS